MKKAKLMLNIIVVLAAVGGILALKTKLPTTLLYTHINGDICNGPSMHYLTTTIDGGGLQILASTIDGGICLTFYSLSE